MNTILEFINRYGHIIFFYLPLGVIGVWRWSVWVLKKTISLFYRQPHGHYDATLSIITPVYNENPELFGRALESWKRNEVDEIIAVIDYSDTENIDLFKKFQKTFPPARLIITEKPGKRPALADGVRASRGEIVALVDSDTVWSPNIKNKLLGPFFDHEVGGIVPRQDVFETDTLARKMFKILLDDRYLVTYPFLATMSDALLCLSGRTAVYRRSAIIDKLDRLVNETFLGRRMISGDDKTLTSLIQSEGWKTRFLRDVKVYTSGNPQMRGFLKQKVRWTRNALRSDFKNFFSGWLWKKRKVLAFFMLDNFIAPITLLIAPIYFIISLYFGHWQIAAIIAGWWIVSRAIKLYPHIKEKPADIFLLPVYILMTFFTAIVKVYALFTIREQGWITRWDKTRLKKLGFLRRLPPYAATSALIFGLSFFVFQYKNTAITASLLKQAQKKEQSVKQAPSIFTPDIPRVSNDELNRMRNELAAKSADNPYGYYVVKAGDTSANIRARFNLAPEAKMLDANTKNPLPILAPLTIGGQIAIPVADLRNPINAQSMLAGDILRKPPIITFERSSNTINLKQGGSIVTLSKIRQALGPAGASLLEETQPGEWLLRANLYVGKNVTLILNSPEVRYLKLKSDAADFIWMRGESGNILISETKITSWDERTSTVDENDRDGRAYITAKNSGRMDIVNSELAWLGYEGAPKRGGLFGGSYGVSWKIKNGGFKDSLLTGVVSGSKFHHNFFGLYTFGATGLAIRDNEFLDNLNYGIDPHDDSNNMLIEGNRVYRNGKHGIILSRRCFGNIIRENTSFENEGHGIMLDRTSNSNSVEKNSTYANMDGIAIYDSHSNLILDNEIRNNFRGIRANENSSGNYFESNTITENSRGIYLYNGANNNIFRDNSVRGSDIAITLKNASENILYDNFEPSANQRDGRVVENSQGNDIK